MKLRNMRMKYATFFTTNDGGSGDGVGGGNDGGSGGGGGSGGDHWSVDAGLPEDIRSWEEVKNAKTPEDFYNQVANMRSRLGRSVTIPSEDAGAEDWQAFFNKLPAEKVLPAPTDEESTEALFQKLGKPQEATGYNVPEGMKLPDDQVELMRQQAFEAGLTQSQFEKQIKKTAEAFETMTETQKLEFTEGMTKLSEEWGMAFEQRKALAEKVRETFFDFIPSEQMDAKTIKAMYEVAKQFGGEAAEMLKQGGSKADGFMSPDEAAVRISEIWNNPAHPYHNPSDPAHKAAKEKMRQLYKMRDQGGETVLGNGTGATAGVGGAARFA